MLQGLKPGNSIYKNMLIGYLQACAKCKLFANWMYPDN